MRNATLSDLEQMLTDQHARKLDLVIPATQLRSRGGLLQVSGADHVVELDKDGVPDSMHDPNGLYRPTDVFVEGVANKLKIPIAYLRRMLSEAPDLFDSNVNGWLHGKSIRRHLSDAQVAAGEARVDVIRPGDTRKFLFRAFRGEGDEGVARALLSDQFGLIENLDVLVAALAGIKAAGVAVHHDQITCDLSDRRMYMRVPAPEVFVEAPNLLKGYRSPFDDPSMDRARQFDGNGGSNTATALERGREALARVADGRPVVFAGLDLRNSEVGQGEFVISPVLIIQVCSNGVTITKEAARRRHVGSKLEEGTIQWSADTVKKTTELITAKTRDTVAAFLSRDFLSGAVAEIEEQAGVRIREPESTIQHVAKTLAFSDSERSGILAHFIAGGQLTAGGLMQAVTSFSQTVSSADRARELDDKALEVLAMAASR